jgi:chemotaxis protein MotA
MLVLLGWLIVIGSVGGGFVMAGGELYALWHPHELLIIGGGAAGAFVVANTGYTARSALVWLGRLMMPSKVNKKFYMDVLSLLYDLFAKSRREGMMSIEADYEEPTKSSIFSKYPSILINQQMTTFICDYLRLVTSGNMASHELDNLMDIEMDALRHEREAPAIGLARVSDALPGFGIVAAVMGIVLSMAAIAEPPEVLGGKVAAALVGTFTGILLAYGIIGPASNAIENRVHQEMDVFQCIKACIVASQNGMPPQLAVEFGRKTIPTHYRPSFAELDKRVRNR